MEILPGKRKDSYLYIYEGFTYNMDKRYTHIYRCAKRRTAACRGVLLKENEKFILESSHNHPSEPYIFDILNLKSEMIKMCQETTTTNKEIFDTVSRKNPKVAANISYNAMRNVLSKEKIKMRPPLPSSAYDLGNLLQDYEPVKFIYKGCIISEDNKCSYIFTSDKLLKILEESSEIFIDGTFSVVPRVPNFAQLFSVHVRYMDKGIAILFILCEARTQLVYKSIWKEVINLAPALQSNLRFIMCDYEKASMNAVHEQFPHASVRGCWFHYCQAVLKKWKRLGLQKAPRKILSMATTLALAPPEMFSEGLNLMQIIADKESDTYPNVLLFMKYMRSTWLPISKKISVYGCPVRTNNLVESFHNIVSQKMQTVHPNLWIFLDNVSKIIKDQEIDYDRLVNGLQVSRNRCQFNKNRNARIKEAQSYLSTGIYSLKEFLQLFEEDTRRQQYNMTLLIDDNDEEISADVHTGGAVETVQMISQSTKRRRRRRRYNFDLNEFEVTTLEDTQQSTSSCSENTIDNNQNILEVIVNIEETSENEKSHASMESTNMDDSDLNTCTVTVNIEQTSENEKSHASMESTNMDDSDVNTCTGDIAEHIYEVPHDDYGYWNNLEEDKEEMPFLSIKTMENISTNNSYEEGICMICLFEKSQIVFVPCGHLCCCKNCIQKLLQEKCPACNDNYDKYISVITP